MVEYHDGFTNPVTTHVTRILLTDDAGNPVFAATDNGDRSFSITHIGEGQAEFTKGLREMGISKTVMVQDAKF